MKIALLYNGGEDLQRWIYKYNVSCTTLEPVLIVKPNAIIPNYWQWGYVEHCGFLHELYNKIGKVLVLSVNCLILDNIDHLDNIQVPITLFGIPTNIYTDMMIFNCDLSDYFEDNDNEIYRLAELVVKLDGLILCDNYYYNGEFISDSHKILNLRL